MKVTRKRILVSVAVVASLLAGSATITAFAVAQPDNAVVVSEPSTIPAPKEAFTKVTPTAVPSPTATPVVAPVEVAAPVAGTPAKSNTAYVPVPDETVWEDAPVYVAPAPIEWETITTQVCESLTGISGSTFTVCRNETTTRPKQ